MISTVISAPAGIAEALAAFTLGERFFGERPFVAISPWRAPARDNWVVGHLAHLEPQILLVAEGHIGRAT